MVDSFHLPHLDEPHPDVLSSRLQNPLAVVLCLIQNLLGEEGVGEGTFQHRPSNIEWDGREALLSKKGCQETVLFFP